MTTAIHISGATLRNVVGNPARQGGFTFQAADLRLDGGAGPLEFPLHDFAGDPPPAVLRQAFEKQYDAVWVRARIPVIFGHTPEFVEEQESAVLDLGFIAVPDDQADGVAFVCADLHGRAGLHFGSGRLDGKMRRRIAFAFWSLLLDKPDDLADSEQMVYHEPGDVWLKLGCLHGRLFCEETED